MRQSLPPLVASLSSLVVLCIAESSEAGTQSLQFQFPPFETEDGWVFSTNDVLSVPQFLPSSDGVVLEEVRIEIQYEGNEQFAVTNIGSEPGFGIIHITHRVDVTAGTVIFGPGYTVTGSGPFLQPGQTIVDEPLGNHVKWTWFDGLAAQAWFGPSDVKVSANIVLRHTIADPANFTASPVGGMPTDPVMTIIYKYKCVSDINDDDVVNVIDLLAVINTWGAVGFCGNNQWGDPAACPTDVAPANGAVWGDGNVDVEDLLSIIQHWGECFAP